MLIDLNREELGFTKEAVETLMLADTSATRDQGDEAMRQQVILDWSKDEDPAAFFRELGDDQEEAERCVQRVFGLVEVHRRIEEALDPGEAEGKDRHGRSSRPGPSTRNR